ncbi:MAG: thiamine pyrophosphate-binding protein [Acidimicrobiales bacterium]
MSTGGEMVVRALEEVGVEVVFGIVSVHNLPIYEALRHHPAIRTVAVRHEQTALGMADGYARTTGRLGVAITSTGPGAANGMGAMLEAWTSSSPVLHLTGQIDSHHLDQGRGFIHECKDQLGMLSSAAKWVRRVGTAGEIRQVVHTAALQAMAPRRGPAAVEIPIDLQYQGVEDSGEALPTLPQPPRPSSGAIDDAVAAIAAAARPLIWAGGGVLASGAEGRVADLAHRLGAGVITSASGRGAISEDDPLCLGNLSWEQAVRDLAAEADLLIAVGTRFQGPNTENWKMKLPSRLVHIDVDPQVIGTNYPAQVAVVGDARTALTDISARLPTGTSPDEAWVADVGRARAQARARLRSTLGPWEVWLDAVTELLPGPGTVVVKDSTIPAYTWGNRLLPVREPRTAIQPTSFAIGLGLPHALGAAVGRPDEATICIVGDGGFMLAATEISTAVQHGIPVVILLFNDRGYGILRNIQAAQFDAAFKVDLATPDFCALAMSMGAGATRVTSVDELEKALPAALESGVVTLIEIDMTAVGDMAVTYTGTSKPPASTTA